MMNFGSVTERRTESDVQHKCELTAEVIARDCRRLQSHTIIQLSYSNSNCTALPADRETCVHARGVVRAAPPGATRLVPVEYLPK